MDKRIATSITSLLERVPGYTGYRSLEDRRDDDRRLRDSIAQQIDGIVQILNGASASLASQRKLTHISVIERLIGSTRLLGDRVRTASYGYGGIFTDRSVDSVAIEQLRQFDTAFKSEVDKLQTLASKLANAPEGPLDVDISAYQDELNRLGRLFDARIGVIDTAHASRDTAVLRMLEPGEEPKASPFMTVALKDAFSVTGEDYIADAVLTFTSGDLSLKLVRAGQDDQERDVWFAGGNDATLPSARLTASDQAAPTELAERSGTLVVTTSEGSQPEVPVQYGYTGGTESEVSVSYTVGAETRSFTGTRIDDSDIQVYGQA